ncbi:MAG: uracil-DNA glycosylase [Gammaproteobacteria bacterium]
MGIDVWQRRGVVAESEADNAAVVASEPDTPARVGDEHAYRVAAMNWDELTAIVSSCKRCPLHQTRTQTVFGVGNRNAEWMVIGEAPGADEDRQGEPFVGRAGRLLNSMLLAIDLPREQVYIANILKCRPPGNRDPKPEEESACRDYLERQIRLVKPKIILAVGRIAAQNLMKVDTPIGKMRGRKYSYQDTSIPVVITYHPAYLLRSPLEKRKAWQDLLFARQVYAGLA